MAVSLRLPEKTKQRVEKLARVHDTTAHAFMVAAIEERLAAEETRAAFYAEAERRLAQMGKTGKGIPAEAQAAAPHGGAGCPPRSRAEAIRANSRSSPLGWRQR